MRISFAFVNWPGTGPTKIGHDLKIDNWNQISCTVPIQYDKKSFDHINFVNLILTNQLQTLELIRTSLKPLNVKKTIDQNKITSNNFFYFDQNIDLISHYVQWLDRN